uniref:Uncharacterized protein n=1 Tax=Arundo donax TaxID=35708 RepID=A0A0A9EHQ7_ARUDO
MHFLLAEATIFSFNCFDFRLSIVDNFSKLDSHKGYHFNMLFCYLTILMVLYSMLYV